MAQPGKALIRAVRSVGIGVRLAAAFGVLASLLVAVALLGASSISALETRGTSSPQGRDISALQLAGGLGEAVAADAHDVVRHLYVFDGDLKTEDEVAGSIAARHAQVGRDVTALRPLLNSADLRAALDRFLEADRRYVQRTGAAVSTSRAETVAEVEERDGSRAQYLGGVVTTYGPAVAAAHALQAALRADLSRLQADASDHAAAGRTKLLVAAALAVLLAIALTLVITRSVTGPVRDLVARLETVGDTDLAELEQGLHALADGDLTRAVSPVAAPARDPSGDELGAASAAVDAVLARTHASMASYDASRGKLGAMLSDVDRRARDVGSSSERMARSTQEATRAIDEIAQAIGDIAAGSERQAQMVSSAGQRADEVRSAIRSAAEAGEASEVAVRRVEALVVDGVTSAGSAAESMAGVRDTAQEVARTMAELEERSTAVTEIVGAITKIADQTNLLALNAAIEAARAGDQGRGFAVVAEEVRGLAVEAQESAQRIAALIDEIQSHTRRAVVAVQRGAENSEAGTRVVGEAREAFEGIQEAVAEVVERIAQVASAAADVADGADRMTADVGEVATVTEHASASTEQVSASTQQTAATAQEVAQGTEELARAAEELQELVGAFRLAPSAPAARV